MQDLARVRQAGADIVSFERWVAVEDLLLGPTRCQEINDELDGDPRALDNRFPYKDLRVHRDVVTPVHALTISEHRPPGIAPGESLKGECPMAQQGLNRVMVLGYLGGTPELKFTNDGKAVARFSVAVNERWKDSEGTQQERVEWIRVVSFGRLAEICGNYLSKGRHVFLEGKLQTRNWEDREGQRRTATEVIAGALRILDSGNRNGHDSRQPAPEQPSTDDAPF